MKTSYSSTGTHLGGILPLVVAWSVLLLISSLPTIVCFELLGFVPGWLFPARLAVLALLLGLGFLAGPLRALRPFAASLLGIALLQEATSQIAATTAYRSWFFYYTAPFTITMLGEQVLNVAVALLAVLLLLLLGFQRKDFFLVRGQLNAPAAPVWFFGMREPEPWTRFGVISIFAGSGAVLAFILIAGGIPSGGLLLAVLPYLPMILLLAAMNAFSEELIYRAIPLGMLQPVVGAPQALAMTAVYFGLGHYFGVPYGIIGVLMAGFMGWLLGKSLLETRGFFWAWFVHLWLDVVIFTFMAFGGISAGGF